MMAAGGAALLLMQNDEGKPSLPVAARAFGCRGASPPHDHPHIYLNMGKAAGEIRCPYCGTLYIYESAEGAGAPAAGAPTASAAEDGAEPSTKLPTAGEP